MTRAPALGTVLWLVALGLVGSVAVLGYMAFRISAQGDRDERRSADAIVVLGAAQFNGTPSDVFAARLQHAVDLWKQGIAPILIVTGGKVPGDRTTEAATARAWAMSHGVPAAAILGEYQGRNTLESIEAVAVILRGHGLQTAVFVSDETHMLRVLRMASDLKIVAYGSPTRTSPSDLDPARRQMAVVHELAGLVAYFLGGGRLIDDSATSTTP